MQTGTKNRKKYNEWALFPALLSPIMALLGNPVGAIALLAVAGFISTCSPFDSAASGFKQR